MYYCVFTVLGLKLRNFLFKLRYPKAVQCGHGCGKLVRPDNTPMPLCTPCIEEYRRERFIDALLDPKTLERRNKAIERFK